jgi:hypothetical protein
VTAEGRNPAEALAKLSLELRIIALEKVAEEV